MLSPELETQIADLAARYGPPERIKALLGDTAVQPLVMTDRIAEVCMVIRRPNGTLLTAIKSFYPPGCYRLLTGGVGHGEGIEEALLREVAEETGLEVVVRRFLAVVEYGATGSAPVTAFATFAFLLDEVGGTLGVVDEAEEIADFREASVEELLSLAITLENTPPGYSDKIEGDWRAWGVFRAVVHHVVYAALA